MPSGAEVAELLGIEARTRGPMSLLGLIAEVERGLPLSALDRLARCVAPDDNGFVFRLVPKATLARRRGAPAARLSSEEGAKVARLADVWAFACEVWGDEEAARGFLFRPHPMLEGQRPVDVVLASEFGRPLVEGILGRLKYGSAA
ncbi:MAG TPA: antitoxin Xre/MbcA/ParS toxin-binding domain-containing protein [Acetobacteraceae bacterium]|jgi:putative toxin-antitoxin system antitoxin component (TIGR02293 family)